MPRTVGLPSSLRPSSEYQSSLSIINYQLSIDMIPVVLPSRNPFSHASRALKVLEILFYFVRKNIKKGCLLDITHVSTTNKIGKSLA